MLDQACGKGRDERWRCAGAQSLKRLAGADRLPQYPEQRSRGAAGGCDIGGIVSSQPGHKCADELHGIHIGSGLPLDFFTGPRAWDFARNRPLTYDQPADVRARSIELDHPSGFPRRLRLGLVP